MKILFPKIKIKVKWYAPGGIYNSFAEQFTDYVNRLARFCKVPEIDNRVISINKSEILYTLDLIREQIEDEFWMPKADEEEVVVPTQRILRR